MNPAEFEEENSKVSSDEHGILKIPVDSGSGEEQWMREHHNANHALWYFSIIIYLATHQKGRQNNVEKTKRILAHLSHLREFIPDQDIQGCAIIHYLIEVLQREMPKDTGTWLQFFCKYWHLLRDFASRYEEQDKCFPESDFRKICDLIRQRQYFRGWWWKASVHRLGIYSKMGLRKIRRARSRP